jgi:hypothetical protein
MSGIELAPMSIRLTPHILSVVDWSNALTDPIRRQFIPLKSSLLPDHPKLSLDSLHETKDSPVPGLVHRYHDKALFLGEIMRYSILTVSYLLIPRSTSNVGMSSVLPFLHSLLFGRCDYGLRRIQKIFRPSATAMGENVRLHCIYAKPS